MIFKTYKEFKNHYFPDGDMELCQHCGTYKLEKDDCEECHRRAEVFVGHP